MRHSKSRFIEDARRVGPGAVENRTYRGWGESVYLFLEFTINRALQSKKGNSVCFTSAVQPNLQSVPVGNERITDFGVLDKKFPMSQS